jgi:anaerobic magnesium-protoporphyrin IX monomethyl ester cyclase
VKVALLNPTPSDLYSPCIRSLTALLKRDGHEVRQIFLPADTYAHLHVNQGFVMQMGEAMVDELTGLVADVDFVGVSFMTAMFDVAVQATRAIQRARPELPIAWGGFHPSTMPKQALEFVDMVCVGEGEEALAELVARMDDGKDFLDVRNFWFRTRGGIVSNAHRPLVSDLDSLPYQDFSFADDWAWTPDQRHLRRIRWADYVQDFVPRYPDRNLDLRAAYKTMITRGCPHKCSYCGVAFHHSLYEGERYLRRRSVEHMIGEIKAVTRACPEIGLVHFQDDVFFSTSNAEIEKFATAWRNEIGLPFRAQCSPTTINEEKYKALIDAGLCFTELGIQTGSSETMRMYRRGMTNEQLLKAVGIISKYKEHTLVPDYHFILDNPWEKTEDVMKGLRLLWTLPPPYNLIPSSLTPYPGTELFRRAIDEGLVTDEYNQVYRKEFHSPNGSYVNFLFWLTLFQHFPKEVCELLADERLVRVLNKKKYDRLWGRLYKWGENARKAQKLSTLAVRGKLLEIATMRDLKRAANQMK